MPRTLLLHSVSYAGLWGQASLPVERFVAHAAELGYGGVMLMAKRPHVSVLDYGDRERAALRSLLEKHNLKDLCIAGYCNLTGDLEHSEVPHKEIHIQYLMELARLTRDLGGRNLRIFTGYEHPSVPLAQQWKLIVDTLKEVSRRAADIGVTLGVQNHHDVGVGFESMHDLIRAVAEPNCRAMFDAWAPALQGVNLIQAAELMASLTVHTTIADYQLRPRYKYRPALVNYEPDTPSVLAVPMGEGFINYKAFLDTMFSGGFEGSISYEMCSPLRDGSDQSTLDSYAESFLEYMRTNFAEASGRAA
jgi:sugar phosphate isomerase/epimerase